MTKEITNQSQLLIASAELLLSLAKLATLPSTEFSKAELDAIKTIRRQLGAMHTSVHQRAGRPTITTGSFVVLPAEHEKILNTPIVDLPGLTIRTINCLRAENMYFVRELLCCNEYQLLKIQGFGAAALFDVKQALRKHNLFLADE